MIEHQVNNLTEYRGDKLKLARMVVGLSCEKLAEKIGKTKQFVSKLEKGCRPSEQCLELIPLAFMIKSSFPFTERKYVLGSDACHFRSKKPRAQTLTNSILARAETLNIIISVVEGEIEFSDVNIPEHSGARLFAPNDIERVAEDCRCAWNLGLGPISSMVKLVKSLGMIVVYVMGADDRADVFTVHNNRPAIIRNNVKKSICRSRSDLGHEPGHLVMHEGITTGDKLTESQANHFSSVLLVPRLSFIKEFPRIRGKQFDWNILVEPKLRQRISLKMCTHRTDALGLLTQEQARTGYMHLSSREYTRVELGDELLRPERLGMPAEVVEILDDTTWLRILMKTDLSQDLTHELFSISRPITNPRNIP